MLEGNPNWQSIESFERGIYIVDVRLLKNA